MALLIFAHCSPRPKLSSNRYSRDVTTTVKRVPPRAQISASTIPLVQTAAPFPEPHFPRRTSLVLSARTSSHSALYARTSPLDAPRCTWPARSDEESENRRGKEITSGVESQRDLAEGFGEHLWFSRGETSGVYTRGRQFVVENEHRIEWGQAMASDIPRDLSSPKCVLCH